MEFLAIVLGIAGLIWGIVLFKRGGLLAGCLLVLLAGACFGDKFFKISGAVPLTIDRLLFVVLAALYFVWRRFGWTDPKPLRKADIVLFAFIAMMIVSTFSADFKASNYQAVAWLIIFYLMPFGLYWIARQTALSKMGTELLISKDGSNKEQKIVLTPFLIFGIYLSVTAVLEHYEIWSLVFPRYIAETAASADAEFVGRARGPFLHPIGNGIALAICLGAAMMHWPRLKRVGQLGLGFVCLLILAGMYFTLTRSVWMGGAFAVALIMGLSLPWSWRLPLFAGGLLVMVGVLVTQWDQLMAFKRDKNLDASKVAESAELRPVLARIAWNMFLDRPLFGCGYSQYSKEHVNYLSDRSTEVVLEKGRGYIQHNVAFSLLAETGLVGLGLFLVLGGLWAIDAWRLWSSPVAPLAFRQMGLLMLVAIGVYAINGLFHDVSVITLANMTLFFLAGITEGLQSEIRARDYKGIGC